MKHPLFFILFLSCASLRAQVTVEWKDSIQDDFSFTENWAYNEGIYLNEWGQLSCDGLCPPEIDPLLDDQGRIYDDSLTKFYTVVDTTHQYFTHEGTARVYEFATCNYAFATKLQGKVHVQTEVNIATHTSLHIVFDPEIPFTERKFKIYLLYTSVRPVPQAVFMALNGEIEISKTKFEEGIVQLRFDLSFESEENDPNGLQTWKGNIVTKIDG
jgi:hypothetical protein